MTELTALQLEAIAAGGDTLLWGNAGTGKTTALQYRLLRLLQSGVSAYNILVLVSEYGHEQPFLELIQESNLGPYAQLNITTYNSLAREMVVLFWPLVARAAGFAHPHQPPTFLEYDMAQLLMWRILGPMQTEGAFADLRLRPQRIVSQLIDILNRAAFNGLTLDEAVARQARVWQHEPDQLKLLHDAAEAARRFRQFCLEHSLLDFSLTIQVFDTHLVQAPHFRHYFSERYQHVLVDNLEEHTFAAQNFVADLMGQIESVVIAYDDGGGYRRFLSADPMGARQLATRCTRQFYFPDSESHTANPDMPHLAQYVSNYLLIQRGGVTEQAAQTILGTVKARYRREMLMALPPVLHRLMQELNVPPAQIAIIAPYLDGALQYTLREELKRAGIPYRLLRRRSSPREEPRVRAWLTWLALAHPVWTASPDWSLRPSAFDVAEALTLSIAGLDPIRAALAVKYLYDTSAGILLPISQLTADLVDRIGPDMAALIERLRLWLAQYGNGALPLDSFLYQLFNDLLCQPDFQPEPDLPGAAICDWLVRTASRLRESAVAIGLSSAAEQGEAFIAGIHQGLVTANPPDLGDPPDPDGVVVATTYGYLLSGISSQVQVWLECNIMGWWQTPYQPLSNAFVMVQSRPDEQLWTAQEEIEIRNELLDSIIHGLTCRCTTGILLTYSDLDRRGQRQAGQLWRAVQPIQDGNGWLGEMQQLPTA